MLRTLLAGLIIGAALALTSSTALAETTDPCGTGEYYGTPAMLYGPAFCFHQQQGQEGQN